MRNVTLIFTSIALIGYIISTLLFLNDPVGSSSKEGIHLFNFFVWFIIPVVLWVIYFLGKQPKKAEIIEFKEDSSATVQNLKSVEVSNVINSKYVDIEHHLLNDKIKNYSDDLKQFTEDLELLIRSLNQKLIDEQKFNNEKSKLETRISSVKESISYCEKRLNAIDKLENELKDLENLCKKKIISIEDKDLKRRELIGNLIKTMD